MKKVLFLSAVALMLGLAQTQVTEAAKVQETVISNQLQDVTYQEITNDKLPEAVTKAVAKDYKDFKIDHSFLGSDGNYKVEISKETLKYSLILSEKGEVIKVEQPAYKKKEQY